MHGNPWGGSEELWSRAALDLLSQGFDVSASVQDCLPLHPRVLDLRTRGIDVRTHRRWYRPSENPLRWWASRRTSALVLEIERLISEKCPSLIVISEGGALPPVDLLELFSARKIPFISISQANNTGWWWSDDIAARYRAVAPCALAFFFVSLANLRLAEMQIGSSIRSAEVVWNPVNLSPGALPSWPSPSDRVELCLACVGRLHPPSKGQDILFQALSKPLWRDRSWHLSLYGNGAMQNVLERLMHSLGLSDRVTFAGFASVPEIWAKNHVLVMPSRYEGLPLAMVEAMLCARPVVATNVAGHAEIVEEGVTGFLAEAPSAASFSDALDRFWHRRGEAEQLGVAGARRIRQLMPQDPVRAFSEKIKQLSGLRSPR